MKKQKMYNFKISVESKNALKIRSKVIDLVMSITEPKIRKNKKPTIIEIFGTGKEASYLYYSSRCSWNDKKDFLKVMEERKKSKIEQIQIIKQQEVAA